MNEANFVKRMNWIATGDTVLREVTKDALKDNRLTSGGLALGNATSPTEEVAGAEYTDGDTSLLTFMLPMDYDSAKDDLVLRFLVQPGSTASDFGVLNTQRRWRAGVVVNSTNGTAAAESATTSSGSLAREVFLSLTVTTGGFEPGDVIQRVLDYNGSGGVATLVGWSVIYGSSVSAYNDDDRHRDMAATTS